MPTGIHHVTGITRDIQANVDFYMGFLGLSLVKRTGGFEDALQLHLFYGDPTGAPGSLVTFLAWQDGAPGRVGHGQVSEIAFAIAPEAIGDWLTRALAAHIPVEGPTREFGEAVLRLRDPDGIIVKLVGVAGTAPQPRRLRAVTVLTEDREATAAFAARFGYRPGPVEGSVRRMVSDIDALDIRDAGGFVPGIPGTGTFDHVALRAPDAAAVVAMFGTLHQAQPTQVHDRLYFVSLYVRDPAGVLFEYASDGPGFAVDEAPDHLGTTLFVPAHTEIPAEDIRVMLPQFALPGVVRRPHRDLPFVHRFFDPEVEDGTTLLTLHGSNGAEADLFPLAHSAAPGAVLLGLRGRATEQGALRWFNRLPAGGYDQDDVRAEAAALAAFLAAAPRPYGIDPARMTVVGYSNGANFAAAAMLLYPQAIRRAALIRPAPVLDPLPDVDLAGARVLVLSGTQDHWRAGSARLADHLAACGADVARIAVEGGHEHGPADAAALRDWLAQG